MNDEKEMQKQGPDTGENSEALTGEELGAGIALSCMFERARQKADERGKVIPLGRPWQGKEDE